MSKFGRRQIFVFGSNKAGMHGAGAALDAFWYHGAVKGQGVGLQGESYAIPTKDEALQSLPLEEIDVYVKEFLEFARKHPNYHFNVTRVGCGLAGYADGDVAPMFESAPTNVHLPNEWKEN